MNNIYKIIFLIILQSPIVNHQSFSQTGPSIQWQKTIGGSNADSYCIAEQTADGGYIMAGWSMSNISGDKTENSIGGYDYWIVKTDSLGNIQWQNTIGGNMTDYLNSIQQTNDGGYILGGRSSSAISGDKTENCGGAFDYWVVKTDSSGNVQWENTIGGTNRDELQSIRQTIDGGYILGGWSDSDISGDKTENIMGGTDYWIVKTDAAGNIQWQNTIGGNDNEQLYTILQTTDGGYMLAGWSMSNISGDKTENNVDTICNPLCTTDYWIVKTDSLGSIQWQNTIGGSSEDYLFSIQQTTDRGYILGGFSVSNISGDKTENSIGDFDYWIIKTDSLGNIQWQNTLGGSIVESLTSIRQTADGGYIVNGWSNSPISGDKTENFIGLVDYWIVKVDSAGNTQWENTIGGNDEDWSHSASQTTDGGYIIAGHSRSNISGDKTENSKGNYDYWTIKLAPDTITGIPNLQSSINNLQFYPNPLTTQSKLTFKNHNKEKFLFTLYDITGRITESVSTTTDEIILTKGSKQPGVYLFDLVIEKTGERWSGKVLITN